MSASKRTPERAAAFCAALAETANVGKACKAIELARASAYEWRDADPDFAEAWDRAMKIGVTALEDEAVRRAHEGVDEPVLYQGQFVVMMEPAFYKNGKPKIDLETGKQAMRAVMTEDGKPVLATTKRYSDQLLLTLLRAHSEKYRDHSKLELGGSLELGGLSDSELEEQIAMLSGQIANMSKAAPALPQDEGSARHGDAGDDVEG